MVSLSKIRMYPSSVFQPDDARRGGTPRRTRHGAGERKSLRRARAAEAEQGVALARDDRAVGTAFRFGTFGRAHRRFGRKRAFGFASEGRQAANKQTGLARFADEHKFASAIRRLFEILRFDCSPGKGHQNPERRFA